MQIDLTPIITPVLGIVGTALGVAATMALTKLAQNAPGIAALKAEVAGYG